jgi:curved DNA-binding protein CbpA
LPLDGRLSEREIHRAYKLLAKRAHPDAGGDAEAFLQISAAHDVLMRERRMPP